MFGEVEGPARTKVATDFTNGGGGVWNRAQGPRRQRGVDRVVVELKGLTVETDEVDLDVTGGEALAGQIRPDRRRVNSAQASDGLWKMREVEAGTEPDLQHLPDERCTLRSPDAAGLLGVRAGFMRRGNTWSR